jgi:hypothetical protein
VISTDLFEFQGIVSYTSVKLNSIFQQCFTIQSIKIGEDVNELYAVSCTSFDDMVVEDIRYEY